MGRGRGKGKRQTVIAVRDAPVNSEEEKLPAYKRRGRPLKPMKDDIDDDEEIEKIEAESESVKSSITVKDAKEEAGMNDSKKRKKPSLVKESSADTTKEGSGPKSKSSTEDSVKSVGIRQNGNRRKSKPRRAAEVGVGCK